MTPPILSTAAISAPAQAPARGAGNRQDDAAPETSFNLILSKEIAQRRNNEPGNSDRPATAAPDAGTTGVAGTAPTKPEKRASETDYISEDSSQPGALPPELAAMVANLMQLKPGSPERTAPANAEAAVARSSAVPDAVQGLPADPATGMEFPSAGLHAQPDPKPATLAGADAPSEPLTAVQPAFPAPAASRMPETEKTASAARASSGSHTSRAAALSTATESGAPRDRAAGPALAAVPAGLTAPAGVTQIQSPELAAADSPQGFPTALQQFAEVSRAAAPQGPPGVPGAPERLTPQVGTPAWDQALGQKVVWMVAGAEQSASLTLNPPDLGPVQVVLNVSNNQATATFTAAQLEVRQALEAALPKLREMLGDAGIQLGQASVNSGAPDQQREPGRPDHPSARGRNGVQDSGKPATVLSGGRALSSGTGLVDTFA
ncbi:MAG: putative flagellar hook-length control protein FliK [Herminiimonas sp.]|nr:putative flagellar hook-length control protein FliK [Herminiimonas sp.]